MSHAEVEQKLHCIKSGQSQNRADPQSARTMTCSIHTKGTALDLKQLELQLSCMISAVQPSASMNANKLAHTSCTETLVLT